MTLWVKLLREPADTNSYNVCQRSIYSRSAARMWPYTNVIGLLDRHYLDSPFSLTEGRVLYEIKQIDKCSAKKIREKIRIDEGYLSRIIDKFIQKGLITKIPSPDDRRVHIICLTEKGQNEFASLNEHSDKLIFQIIEKLSGSQRTELARMMEKIQNLLEND